MTSTSTGAPGDNRCEKHGLFAGRHCPDCEMAGSAKGGVWTLLVIVVGAAVAFAGYVLFA